jgi:hypothetical protein
MKETLFQELQYSTQDRDSSLFPNSHDCCIVERGLHMDSRGLCLAIYIIL